MSRSVTQLVYQNGRYVEAPPPKQKEKKEKRNYFTELAYRRVPPPPLRPAPELPQNKRRVHKGDLVWICLGGSRVGYGEVTDTVDAPSSRRTPERFVTDKEGRALSYDGPVKKNLFVEIAYGTYRGWFLASDLRWGRIQGKTKAEMKRWKEEMKHQQLREARAATLRQEAEEALEGDVEVGQEEGKSRKKRKNKKGCDILSLTDFLERVRDEEESREEDDEEEGRRRGGRSTEEIYDEYLGLGIGASRQGRSSQEYRKWLQEKEKNGPSICDLLVLETIKTQKKLRKQARRWKKHEKNLIEKHLARASANDHNLFSSERRAGWKGGDDDTEDQWSEDDGQCSCIDLESSICWTPGVREWGQEEVQENNDQEREPEEGVGEVETRRGEEEEGLYAITERISILRHSFLNFGGDGVEEDQGERSLTSSTSSLLSSLGFVGFDSPNDEVEDPFTVSSAATSAPVLSWGQTLERGAPSSTSSPSCPSDDPEMRLEMRKLEELFHFGFLSKAQLEERKGECKQVILEKRMQRGKERKKKEKAEKLREKLRLIREEEEKNNPSETPLLSSKKVSTVVNGKSPNTTGNPSYLFFFLPLLLLTLLLGKQPLPSAIVRGRGKGKVGRGTAATSAIEPGSRGRGGRGRGGRGGRGDFSATKEGPQYVKEGSGRRGRGGSTGEEHTRGRGRRRGGERGSGERGRGREGREAGWRSKQMEISMN